MTAFAIQRLTVDAAPEIFFPSVVQLLDVTQVLCKPDGGSALDQHGSNRQVAAHLRNLAIIIGQWRNSPLQRCAAKNTIPIRYRSSGARTSPHLDRTERHRTILRQQHQTAFGETGIRLAVPQLQIRIGLRRQQSVDRLRCASCQNPQSRNRTAGCQTPSFHYRLPSFHKSVSRTQISHFTFNLGADSPVIFDPISRCLQRSNDQQHREARNYGGRRNLGHIRHRVSHDAEARDSILDRDNRLLSCTVFRSSGCRMQGLHNWAPICGRTDNRPRSMPREALRLTTIIRSVRSRSAARTSPLLAFSHASAVSRTSPSIPSACICQVTPHAAPVSIGSSASDLTSSLGGFFMDHLAVGAP